MIFRNSKLLKSRPPYNSLCTSQWYLILQCNYDPVGTIIKDLEERFPIQIADIINKKCWCFFEFFSQFSQICVEWFPRDVFSIKVYGVLAINFLSYSLFNSKSYRPENFLTSNNNLIVIVLFLWSILPPGPSYLVWKKTVFNCLCLVKPLKSSNYHIF